MRSYSFIVQTLPPKKDGANSMWGKELEAYRLISLRLAATKAFIDSPPLRQNIELEIIVHIPQNSRTVGDLDNFVTGVCDGLMACDSKSKLSAKFSFPEYQKIHPSKVIGIVDDSEVISIVAKKVFGDCSEPYYTVNISGI